MRNKLGKSQGKYKVKKYIFKIITKIIIFFNLNRYFNIILSKNKNMRIVVLVSGNGSNLQRLIDSVHKNENVNGNIVGVISNKENAYGLERAQQANIPTQCISYLYSKTIPDVYYRKTRDEFESDLCDALASYEPDLIVLAGWMHIMGKRVLDQYSSMMINLHPALPNTFVGTHCIEKAWGEYVNGKITETGVMVHWVTSDLDKGDCIQSLRIPIHGCNSVEDLTERIQCYEKDILENVVKMIISLNYVKQNELCETEGSRVKLIQTGKVRNIYDIGHNLLAISHSDRLSSFDRHICDVPGKGHILTESSAFWFHKIKEDLNIDHHFITSKDNVMVVKKCKVLPIEVVVRGYITGSTQTSLWTHYKNGTRNYCGIQFPDGLVKNQKLENNVITPTTKGEVDELITAEEIVAQGYMTQEQWDEVSTKAMRIFEYGQHYAAQRGLLLVDTKYEFGVDVDGNILLIDEVHTCDSSRYWFQDSYDECMRQGQEPKKYDKDIIRDYIKNTVDDPYKQTEFTIPEERVENTIQVYRDFYALLTGTSLDSLHTINVESYVKEYFKDIHWVTHDTLVILSGSTSDHAHVTKLRQCAEKMGLYVISHVSSAHKNTLEVMSILDKYNSGNGRVIYITVAGRSNALSGVVASNTQYPTIACPPFKDKDDMMVNINSTLQCPSKVPVMTILEPLNVAIASSKIFALGK